MKILIHSSLFFPSTGGMETFAFTMAHEFVNTGHLVKVVTETSVEEADCFPFEVYRSPDHKTIVKLMDWCDVCLCNAISLKFMLPLLRWRKKMVVSHQTWYQSARIKLPQDYLKLFLTHFVKNVAISKEIANSIPGKSTIIPNPYQDHLFQKHPESIRDKDLVFLGRLVSDKGADMLLQALVLLKKEGLSPSCTIIGEGPEKESLINFVCRNDLKSQVTFTGKKSGLSLVALLNQHKIMVIPSRWNEPFGIVALEGIACGCVIVGSEGGGLKEAIGPCGVTFPNGDVKTLADRLKYLLSDKEIQEKFRENAPYHLERHQQKEIAAQYLKVFEEITNV